MPTRRTTRTTRSRSRRPARSCRRTSTRCSSPTEVGNYSINGPLAPRTGEKYAYSQVGDAAYKRLTRTVDLTGKTSGTLKFWTSYDTEPDYDYLFVEAHTVGQDDWTTLPDENGNTSQALDPAAGSCCGRLGGARRPAPVPRALHEPRHVRPHGHVGRVERGDGQLRRLPGLGDRPLVLRRQQVEVSITVASDPFVQGVGVFVDDTEVLADGQSVAATSFEDGFGGWAATGPPDGSDAESEQLDSDRGAGRGVGGRRDR